MKMGGEFEEKMAKNDEKMSEFLLRGVGDVVMTFK